ncbi:MAG TPA: cell wall hydrolase [Steroidobacteraceae bacterium]|nr:cell wall hydrolase [Steroidobacteraceae bacterium]
MLTSLIIEARLWRLAWRHRLAAVRFGAAGSLMFVAMLGLPALGMGGIIYFAYWNGAQLELQAEQRAAARALRRARDLQCLAENVYFEARGEPLAGQYAVAEVTLNRTQAPNFPHTICAVVHETRWDPGRRRYVADFSWTELGAASPNDGPAWRQAMAVASAELDDLHESVVPGALYYHATSIHPGWSRTRKVVAVIGNHIFYQ